MQVLGLFHALGHGRLLTLSIYNKKTWKSMTWQHYKLDVAKSCMVLVRSLQALPVYLNPRRSLRMIKHLAVLL